MRNGTAPSAVAPPGGATACRADARWGDAIPITVSLWLFVALIYLPILIERHAGEGVVSVMLDASTIFVSMLFALALFALFRATFTWRPVPRLVLIAAVVILVAISQAALDLLFTAWVAHTLDSNWMAIPRDLRRAYDATINYASMFAVNVALFQFVWSRRKAAQQERRMAAMLATGQQAELEALRFRLNPHFLFNTLNAISGLIVTRRGDDADRVVERLSAFLRASFAYDPMALVPVEEELAAIEHYVRIEEMRFGDRLEVEVDCDSQAAALRMPALLLQPIVETAIEAATARPGMRGCVTVSASADGAGLRLVVTHDTPLAGGDDAREAVEHRLAAFYGDEARVTVDRDGAGARLMVCLPAEAVDAMTPERRRVA